MNKDVFANSLDYMGYNTLKTESVLILQRNENYYYIVQSSNGFIVWVDVPLYCHYLENFKSFEEARNYLLGTPKHHHSFRDLFHHWIV